MKIELGQWVEFSVQHSDNSSINWVVIDSYGLQGRRALVLYDGDIEASVYEDDIETILEVPVFEVGQNVIVKAIGDNYNQLGTIKHIYDNVYFDPYIVNVNDKELTLSPFQMISITY